MSARPRLRTPGFTLIELILVIVLLGILATIALGEFRKIRVEAQNSAAIAEIRTLTGEIDQYEAINGRLPATLVDIGRDGLHDPWGNAYVYVNFGGIVSRRNGGGGGSGAGGISGKARKDKNLVPLNSTYDLYSPGADGQTNISINNKYSLDDILRANDGAYIGLAAGY